MRVTTKDIARICSVSVGTVDRALNNRPGISKKTKKRILQVAEQLNYQPDLRARSLVMGKTMTIGVVLFDLYNRSFAQLMNAIELRARESGYSIYITLTDKNPESEKKCIEDLVHRKVDGIILFTVNQGEHYDQYLNNFEIPIVTVFNYISDKWNYVGIQERSAMKDAVDYIISKNYKHFIYISPPLAYLGKTNIYTQEERLKGFLAGINENGINNEPVIIKHSDYIAALDAMDFVNKDKTAIICSCDLYALEVMRYCKAKGINIPEDVGVMGFDNIDMLKYVSPILSTVQYPIEEIGFKSVESLIHKIENGRFLSISLLDYQIIEGESI